MALKPCRQCGKELSTEAEACPHCGAKVRKPTSVLTWIGAIILAIIVFNVLTAVVPDSSGPSTYEIERQAKAAALASVKIEKYSWQKGGFDNILLANFTLRNTGTRDVKDIEVTCTSYGNSGTRIDSNERVIYETIKAGKTHRLREFNMGFQHTQTARAGCEVTGLELI
jgi:RNA polymerase subunit RPABC4/transcription elongation factor Spt4